MGISEITLALILGVLIGVTMGLLGGGGAVLAITVLIYIFHENTSVAASTSLAIVGSGSIIGAIAHAISKDVRFKLGIITGISSIAGTFPGAWLNHHVSENILLLLFGILVILIGIDMLMVGYKGKINELNIDANKLYSRTKLPQLTVLGLAVGFLASFFGMSGGFMIIPALIFIAKLTPRQAIGTTLFITTITSTSGFLSHLHFGNVDFKLASLFVTGGVFGVIIGTLLSEHIAEKNLSRIFAVFLILLAIYIIYRNI